MDSEVLAALIAAIAAAVFGIINFLLTIHRNKQDGIIKYRMEWIDSVRNEFSTIFGWELFSYTESNDVVPNSLQTLRNAINKVALYLNVRDDYDGEILKLCLLYLKKMEAIYQNVVIGKQLSNDVMALFLTGQNNTILNETQKIKEELFVKIRIYLKVEWTRVKVDSSLLKFKYMYCWCPIKGFLPNKAITRFERDYIKVNER